MPNTIQILPTGTPTPEVTLRAYALQPGRETLLAHGISNEKGECKLEYEWSGGKALHVQVRAYAFDGAALGASEVVYNAKSLEQIRFSVAAPAAPKEYEGIRGVLRHILPEGQALAADESALVVKSLGAYAGEIPKVYRDRVNEARLDYWVHSESLASESGLPAAFFYGISRVVQKKNPLSYFLETGDDLLWAHLDKAEGQNLVEAIDRPALSRQLELLRKSKKRKEERHLWGQLLDATNDAPLAGLLVRAFGPDSGDTLAGEDQTGLDGRFFIRVPVPAVDGGFRLEVFRGENEELYKEDVHLQDAAFVVRLQVPARPDLSPTLRKTADDTSWTQLQAYLPALEAAGIRSLQELREKGLAQVNLPADIARRLEAHAQLDMLPTARPAFARDLIAQGYDSPLAIARSSKRELIANLRDRYGDFFPASLHEQALALEAGLNSFYAREVLESGVFTQDSPADDPAPENDPLDLVPQACGCQHCNNAVSSAAYLTELLGYALRHVKKGDQLITLADLEQAFHQPFGGLSITCSDSNRTVRQIRLGIEVLRAYLEVQGLPEPNTPEAAKFETAGRNFRQQVYLQLLERLNTSYDAIRDIQQATSEEKAGFAKGLHIPLQHEGQETLEALCQRPETLLEAALEQLFGWRDTARDPLTEPAEAPLFLQWSKDFLRQNWWKADWPENPESGARPWIDPDRTGLDYLVEALSGAASDLWHARRDILHNQFENYRQTRENAANDLAAWDALFPNPDILEQIRQADKPAGDYLDGIHHHIQKGSPISNPEWENVYHILVQQFKSGQYVEWRGQEKDAGIFLSPDFFRIPPPVFDFDQVQEENPAEWRAKRGDFRDWRDRLEARLEQDQTAAAALAEAVEKTEEAYLPALRQILVAAGDSIGAGLYEKASRLTERLLIDMAADGCKMTTRIQQAIESVQLLIWGIRSGQLEDTHPDWSLEAEKFEDEWKWLGSYATWRSAMLVFLYPENLLQPTLRRMQTPVFRTMADNTRNSAQFSPRDACMLAGEYSRYWEDVSNLSPVAAVIALTKVAEGDCGNRTGGGERRFVYLFAQSSVSKKVYMARYPEGEQTEQSIWEEVAGLGDCKAVIGACVYAVAPGERYIYLFAKVQDGRSEELVYTRYDLQKDAWSAENNQLERPENPNSTTFDAVVKKAFREDVPPHLAFRTEQGELYGRRMNLDGTDWQAADFEMLETQAYLPAMRTARLCEMVESTRSEYYLIRETSAAVEYRLFGPMDDGQWRRVGPKHCLGASPWQTGGVYVFLGNPEEGYNPQYVLINRPEQEPNGSIIIKTFRKEGGKLGLEEYLLEKVSGLNLNEIPINYHKQIIGLVDFLLLTFDKTPNKSEYLDRYLIAKLAEATWIEDYKNDVGNILAHFSNENIENKIGRNWLYASDLIKKITGSPNWNLQVALGMLFYNRIHDFDFWDKIEGKNPYVLIFKERTNIEQELSGFLAPILPGLRKIVVACGKTPLNPYVRVFYSIKPYGLVPPQWDSTTGGIALAKDVSSPIPGSTPKTSLFRSTLFNNLKGIQLRNINPELAAPRTVSNYNVRSNYTEAEMTQRRSYNRSVFKQHDDARPWVKIYFEEAFFFLPVYLALQLKRNGFYQEAADWFRTVYDFTRPLAGRKIYYGLIEEETLGAGLERMADWLVDPLNPHAIAASRTNTYTRFTLLSIIRLLIDHANAEFTRYTPDTVPRARTLYQTALNLLKAPELAADPAYCEKALEEINQLAAKNLHSDYASVWKEVQARLGKIGKTSLLKSAVSWAKDVLNKNISERERLLLLSEGAHNQFGDLPSTTRAETVLEQQSERAIKIQTALLRRPKTARSLAQLSAAAGRDYARKVSLRSGIAEADLNAGPVAISWLGNNSAGEEEHLDLELHLTEAPALAYGFCIPDNPIIEAWGLEAAANLYKLHNCRDIAGLERQPLLLEENFDAYTLPSIGNRGDIALSDKIELLPTPYRYVVLIERAKQLANMAQQMESYFLSALEKRDAEMYQRLKAGQEVELTRAGVRMNQLKVREAEDGVVLAELQRDRAEIQEEHYQMLLNEGLSGLETAALAYMIYSRAFYGAAAVASGGSSWLGFISLGLLGNPSKPFENLGRVFEAQSKQFEILATFERRKEDWTLARNIARQDVRIGNQQIRLSQHRLRIVNQEHHISELQSGQARETLDFLVNKFTNADLYDWMSGVLEGVYSTFLQQATAVAQLAEQQLNFERQVDPRFIIQSDYWSSPQTLESIVLNETVDRRGMTGSARLLRDLSQLDQYAFSTDRRKHELSKTISLAQMSPVEFQQFRQTGMLPFRTEMNWFDRDFPGHYLRLIKRVRISVLALVPPVDGIKAMFSSEGISRVVVNPDAPDLTNLDHGSESIAFTSPINASGQFEMELQPQNEMRRPFESNGVAASWILELPKAANQFDYNTIADVLVTIDYTALYSDDYRKRVIQTLDRSFSGDRAFSFRREFPDQWYDLNHPEQSNEPMVVRFDTLRGDFPANIEEIKLQQVVLYVVRKAGFQQEITVKYLRFQPEGSGLMGGSDDQNLDTVNGILSTLSGFIPAWDAFRGKTPVGAWTLALADTPEMRQRFRDEQIEDILFVLTVEGETPAWPDRSI